MNNHCGPSRSFDTRDFAGGRGGNGRSVVSREERIPPKQQRQSQQAPTGGASHQQNHQQHQLRSSYTSGSGNETLFLQKLQGALSAVRRERDHEFRNRNMAREKCRSAQEAAQSTKKAVEQETAKLDENIKKTQQAIQDIQKMEGWIADLYKKYEFKHEDLIRKRDKIVEYTLLADKEGQEQDKTLDSTQKLIEKQQGLYEDTESTATRLSISRILSQVKSGNVPPSTEAKVLSSQQKRDENLLIRDLQALADKSSMLILPQMIIQKVTSVAAETKLIHKEISRLGNLLKDYQDNYVQKKLEEQQIGISNDDEKVGRGYARGDEQILSSGKCLNLSEEETKIAPTQNGSLIKENSVDGSMQAGPSELDGAKIVARDLMAIRPEESIREEKREILMSTEENGNASPASNPSTTIGH
ncbi:hypothetical protein IV203_036039 [Nitzschia inconspicua]|uniref:Uncharacterized protein n=1 Tax=Nitzschia inconspicua TaxID=303405 RepID=A0A9K3PV55_9STRA|nr:hypothetical protein IV203_036039 [Nitzschia inconspicua]